MKQAFIFIVLFSMVFSCTSDDVQNTEVRIRLSNISEFNFENLIYNPLSQVINLDILNAYETTNLEVFEMAYEAAFIKFEVNGESYGLTPVDLLGEVPLSNGDYTYEIDFNPNLTFPILTQLIEE